MNRHTHFDPEDLGPLTTFGLSARAKAVRCIQSQADLLAYIGQAMRGEPVVLLGEGSNTVWAGDLPGTTIWVMQLKGRDYLGVEKGCHLFRLAAGENWHNWVEWSVSSGYPGLENLALIPGSVGASPIQNIGAYGVELKDRVQAIHGFDVKSGETRSLSVADCEFAYRDSCFKREMKDQFIITEVDFKLPVQWEPVLSYGDLAARCDAMGGRTPAHVMQAVIQTRTEKLPDPAVLGNSGSFFKNPVVAASQAEALQQQYPQMPVFPQGDLHAKLAAGWLIEQCGLKGHQIGGVQVYPRQALILTNTGRATLVDLHAMMALIQARVHEQFGVHLEPEPNLLGQTSHH